MKRSMQLMKARLIHVSSILCLALISSCSSPDKPDKPDNESKGTQTHALLVGIGNYIDPSVQTLEKPVNDVRNMQTFIEKHFVGKKNITVLTDHDGTRNAILSALDHLTETVKQGDQVVFYYSGHGSQVPDDNNEEEDGMDETIASADAKFQGGEWHHMIRDDELDQRLQQMEAKGVDVLVISDACHSGTITKSTGSGETEQGQLLYDEVQKQAYAKRRKEEAWLNSSPYRTTWTAVASGQSALENPSVNSSIYTTLFIEGIADKRADYNHNGVVSNGELHQYLLDSSEKYCELSQCEKGLTPTLAIHPEYVAQPFIYHPDIERHQSTGSGFTLPNTTILLEETLAQKLSNDVVIELKHKAPIKLGDEVFVGVTTAKAGYLVLLDVNAKGELIQLFPNEKATDNKLQGGKTRYIPKNALDQYAIEATEVGKSHMYAIVAHDKIDLARVLNKNKDLEPILRPDEYAGELTQKLNEPWVEEAVSRLSDYSVARVDYTVHPQDK